MKLRGTLIPEHRCREGGQVVFSTKAADFIDERGVLHDGETRELRTAPCTWWQWLGRRWFVKASR